MNHDHHRLSQDFAYQADILVRRGAIQQARELYAEAAWHDEQTLKDLENLGRPRTLSIIGVNSASLYYKATRYRKAEELCYQLLGREDLAPFARLQLKELLQEIWNDQLLLVSNQTNALTISAIDVALRGREIGFGVAPLDEVVIKLDGVQKIIYRLIEYLKGFSFRVRGGPPEQVVDYCRAYVSQARSGSYRFTISLRRPEQLLLFPQDQLDPDSVADRLISVIAAVSYGAGAELRESITDQPYRDTIIKLVRNVIPDGNRIKEVEFSRLDNVNRRRAVLNDSSKTNIRRALEGSRDVKPPVVLSDATTAQTPPRQQRGVLRGLHLDEKWLEIRLDTGGSLRCEIDKAIVVDDVVGPMVDKMVTVVGHWRGRRRPRFFVEDVELAEDS